jgi:bifunctional non-homologous end joining protein LigD
VPKGPAIDPSVKRLAMHVEDHPIEYGTFEGVIPEGYGAGVVMLWDVGTWTPETDDIDASLKKGDLKFTLNGYKLKGSWVLVKTRGWGGGSKGGEKSGGDSSGRSWLLIKHRDDWAGPIDITSFAPLSVKSEQTFRGILTQENPGVWHSNRAAAGMSGDAAMAKIVEKVIALEEEEGTPPKAEAASPAKKAAKKPAAKAKAKAAQAEDDDDQASESPAKAAPAKSRSKATGAAKGAKRAITATPARAAKKR